MNLAVFERPPAGRQEWRFYPKQLEYFREPKRGKVWVARMFEPVLARERRRASSAATENTKDLWRAPAGGKIDLSEKIRQIH